MDTEILSKTAETLINTGNEKFMWMGAGLVIFQVVLIPVIGFLFKHYGDQNKKLTDSEREVTRLKRDAENEKTNSRIDAVDAKFENKMVNLETVISSKITEFEYKLENTCKAIERVGNKMDLHFSKAHKSD